MLSPLPELLLHNRYEPLTLNKCKCCICAALGEVFHKVNTNDTQHLKQWNEGQKGRLWRQVTTSPTVHDSAPATCCPFSFLLATTFCPPELYWRGSPCCGPGYLSEAMSQWNTLPTVFPLGLHQCGKFICLLPRDLTFPMIIARTAGPDMSFFALCLVPALQPLHLLCSSSGITGLSPGSSTDLHRAISCSNV